MRSQSRQVRILFHRYRIRKVTLATLHQVIHALGYTIVKYCLVKDSAPEIKLLASLNLTALARTAPAFSYADQYLRLIFIRTGFSEEEQLALLGHELGHIWNKHLDRPGILGEEIFQEQEANLFLYYLLDNGFLPRLNRWWARFKKPAIFGLLAAAFLCLGYYLLSCPGPTPANPSDTAAQQQISQNTSSALSETGYYWITESGQKYHLRTCQYVSDKEDSISCLPLSLLQELGYEPCSVCLKEASLAHIKPTTTAWVTPTLSLATNPPNLCLRKIDRVTRNDRTSARSL